MLCGVALFLNTGFLETCPLGVQNRGCGLCSLVSLVSAADLSFETEANICCKVNNHQIWLI